MHYREWEFVCVCVCDMWVSYSFFSLSIDIGENLSGENGSSFHSWAGYKGPGKNPLMMRADPGQLPAVCRASISETQMQRWLITVVSLFLHRGLVTLWVGCHFNTDSHINVYLQIFQPTEKKNISVCCVDLVFSNITSHWHFLFLLLLMSLKMSVSILTNRSITL